MALTLKNKWRQYFLFLALVIFFWSLPLIKPTSSYFNSIAHAGFFNNDLETFEEIVDLIAEKYVYSPDHKKLFTAAIDNLIKTADSLNIGLTNNSNGGTITHKYDTRDVTKVTSTVGLSSATEAGTTVFLDCATLSGGTLTLPVASEGRFVRIYVDVGSNTACNINAASADYFYGAITHVSTTDNKVSVQRVLRATAAAAVSTHNQITLDQDSNNIGGAAGSCLELTCYDDAGWFVTGTLIGNSTTPTSIAAINGQ